jgi:hypothetical protein
MTRLQKLTLMTLILWAGALVADTVPPPPSTSSYTNPNPIQYEYSPYGCSQIQGSCGYDG